MWPEKNRKSLGLKMICAGAFVLMAISAAQINGGFTKYTVFMIFGAFFGFLGDYFLHAKGSLKYFITGLSSFLIGHIMYAAAFSVILLRDFLNYSFFGSQEILLYAVILVGIPVALRKFKMKFKPKALIIAILLYAVVIAFMSVKAFTLALYCFSFGYEFRVFIMIFLILGSLCFLISDLTLAIILFGGKKGLYNLKIFNIVMYFAAQMMLASTLLFLS